MDDYDSDYAYYLSKSGLYIGTVTMDSLKANNSIENAIVDTTSIVDSTPISDLIGTVADSSYQTVVVDEKGKYKGSISKTKLLKTLDEGVDHGN